MSYDVDMVLNTPGAGGVLFNDRDGDGTLWLCSLDDGWLGSPGPTTQFSQRSGDHGSISGQGFLAPRVVTLSGIVRAKTDALLFAAQSRLKRNLGLDVQQFSVDTHGRMLTLLARRSGSISIDPSGPKEITWSATLTADDPRLYEFAEYTVLPGVPAVITNEGDIGAHVVMTLNGRIEGAHINASNPGGPGQPTSGGSLWFSDAYHLAAGHSVELGSQDRYVIEDLATNRDDQLTFRSWFMLEPGNNTVTLSGANIAGAQLRIRSGSAWQ